MNYELWITNYGLRIMDYDLLVMDYESTCADIYVNAGAKLRISYVTTKFSPHIFLSGLNVHPFLLN